MTHELPKLKKAAEAIKLSHTEKSAMHAQIFGVPTPFAQPVRSSYVFFFSYQRAFAFAVVMLLLVGTTTTYAAAGSVPGDLLYPVKINVNEPTRAAPAVSSEAKLSFHTEIAEERLREAETLAAEGRLDEEAAAHIEMSVESHIAEANAIAESLEEEDEVEALEASAILDSSLSAHSRILASLGEESDDKNTKEYSRSLSQRSWSGIGIKGRGDIAVAMQARSKEAASDESNTTMSLTVVADSAATPPREATTSPAQKRLVLELQKKAQAKVDEAYKKFASAEGTLAATTSVDIETQLTLLSDRIEEGKEQYKNEDYEGAKQTFTATIQTAVELGANIDASKKFKRDFVRGGWWGRGWDDDDDERGEDRSDDKGGRDDGEDDEDVSHDGGDDNGKDEDEDGNLTLPVKVTL